MSPSSNPTCSAYVCASAIPNHWMRTMPPAATSTAAVLADTLVADAFRSLFATDSPPDRTRLASTAAQLPVRDGGLGLANYASTAAASFASSFLSTWQTCCRVCPPLAALSFTSSAPSTTAAFAAAYSSLSALLLSVESRHRAFRSVRRMWVDGTLQQGFHPALPQKTRSLPSLADLALRFATPLDTTPPRASQRTCAAIAYAGAGCAIRAAAVAARTRTYRTSGDARKRRKSSQSSTG